MPLTDLICDDCGYTYIDRYFKTRKEMLEPQACPECAGPLRQPAPNIVYHSFKPFTHMTKDGRTHRP